MKILVASASRKLPLLRAIAAQAPDATVIAGDADPQCLAAYAWPDFWHLPRLDDADPASLLDQVSRAGITHVVPTRDGDLAWWAPLRETWAAAGVATLVPSVEAVETCRDKLAFARCLADAGLPSIATSPEPLDAPRMVVKERYGAGSVGLLLDVDPETAQISAEALDEPVFQPFIPGPETSIDAYRADDGRLLGLVARSRDLVIGGESQVTTTTDPAPYRDLVIGVLEAAGVTGHAVLQVIDAEGGPVVVECNARLGGASTLALSTGLLSIAWFLCEAAGEDPGSIPFTPTPWPQRLIRTPEDHIGDPRP